MAQQACLIRGRSPSHAHHIRFAIFHSRFNAGAKLLAIDAASMPNVYEHRLAFGWKLCVAPGKVNSVFASTTSGASALPGVTTRLGMSRSLTTTRRFQ